MLEKIYKILQTYNGRCIEIMVYVIIIIIYIYIYILIFCFYGLFYLIFDKLDRLFKEFTNLNSNLFIWM
jgi:hypothetical protein